MQISPERGGAYSCRAEGRSSTYAHTTVVRPARKLDVENHLSLLLLRQFQTLIKNFHFRKKISKRIKTSLILVIFHFESAP